MENGTNRTHYRFYFPRSYIPFSIFPVSETKGFTNEKRRKRKRKFNINLVHLHIKLPIAGLFSII